MVYQLTGTGPDCTPVEPMPRAPERFEPQHRRLPSLSSAHAVSTPPAIAATCCNGLVAAAAAIAAARGRELPDARVPRAQAAQARGDAHACALLGRIPRFAGARDLPPRAHHAHRLVRDGELEDHNDEDEAEQRARDRVLQTRARPPQAA